MYLKAIKECAERILRERGSELTEEERAYLLHVIEEGRGVGGLFPAKSLPMVTITLPSRFAISATSSATS